MIFYFYFCLLWVGVDWTWQGLFQSANNMPQKRAQDGGKLRLTEQAISDRLFKTERKKKKKIIELNFFNIHAVAPISSL